MEAGALLDTTPRLAYNSVLQPYGAKLSESLGAWQVPYAISPPENASEAELRAFLEVGGAQVRNLPKAITTLVIPFGSGNTTAGIFYGLATHGEESVDRVLLVGVGPDRTEWLKARLERVGILWDDLPFQVDHSPLHGWFAEYADLMPETLDSIELHPTYEGKVARFLNILQADWWTRRDGSVGFWIVGGPF
jgi:hypothetical protein